MMKTPPKLESWELARIEQRLRDEVYERTTGPFSRKHCCGDPNDIVALEKAIAILNWHSK